MIPRRAISANRPPFQGGQPVCRIPHPRRPAIRRLRRLQEEAFPLRPHPPALVVAAVGPTEAARPRQDRGDDRYRELELAAALRKTLPEPFDDVLERGAWREELRHAPLLQGRDVV